MTHEQPDNFGGLTIAFKREIVPSFLRKILAGQHDVWSANQCGEIALERFDVHRSITDGVEKRARQSNSSSASGWLDVRLFTASFLFAGRSVYGNTDLFAFVSRKLLSARAHERKIGL